MASYQCKESSPRNAHRPQHKTVEDARIGKTLGHRMIRVKLISQLQSLKGCLLTLFPSRIETRDYYISLRSYKNNCMSIFEDCIMDSHICILQHAADYFKGVAPRILKHRFSILRILRMV